MGAESQFIAVRSRSQQETDQRKFVLCGLQIGVGVHPGQIGEETDPGSFTGSMNNSPVKTNWMDWWTEFASLSQAIGDNQGLCYNCFQF